jgi:aminoglycoside phosphotransferase (APT) family kinase protein
MPKYGPHLPDIEKKVHDKIAELGLTPAYVFNSQKHQERFYTAPCRDKKGCKIIFKMRTEDFWETRESFRREIRINRLFTEASGKDQELAVPRFIAGESECVPEWMLYEFIEGKEAGDFYNGVLPENIGKISIPSLVAGMKKMRYMSAFATGKIELQIRGYREFREAYEKYGAVLRPFMSEASIAAGAKILKEGAALLDDKRRVIAHGDLHPGNLVITPEGKIAIIDWYYVHLSNAAFDIAFLYLEITEEDFRREFMERYVAEVADDAREFCELFRLNILRIVPQKISILRDALYTQDPKESDYYEKLTSQGAAKLAKNLEAFERALKGDAFF